MRLGLKVKEDWIVFNAAVYLWNYHLPLFSSAKLESIYEALEEVVGTLHVAGCKDSQLLCSVSYGLAVALEAREAKV